MFNFTSIPGCVVWLETDESGVVNKLREVVGSAAGDVFIWEDPNRPGHGLVVAYQRELDAAERQTVEAELIARTQPALSGLPTR
jgi:hypothetical protein